MKLKYLVPTLLATFAFALPAFAEEFNGDVTVVVKGDSTITVQNHVKGDRVFHVTGGTKILGKNGKPTTLADLKPGDHVEGTFETAPDGTRNLSTLKNEGKPEHQRRY